jgi:hypothetical protein
MPLTLTRRELRGAHIYFIPVGTVVDGGTVTKTSWPDGVPATNYTDWKFNEIESVVYEVEKETEAIKVPTDNGGYDTDEEETIVGRRWKAKTPMTNSLIKQLENGLANPAASGVAQKPMQRRDATLEGVLLIELTGRAQSGVIERHHTWAKLKVNTPAGAEPSTSKLELDFKGMESSLNTFISL